MKRRRQRHICWDLDETLGEFRDPERMKLTRGIRPLLEKLQRQGCRHLITTAAAKEHAEWALGVFGLEGYFDRIFDHGEICDAEHQKHYRPVIEHLGLCEQEAHNRVMVIGNSPFDMPADISLLFFFHPHSINYDASVTGALLSRLMGLSGSWGLSHEFLSRFNYSQLVLERFIGGINALGPMELAVGYSVRYSRMDRVISPLHIPDDWKTEKREEGVTQTAHCL